MYFTEISPKDVLGFLNSMTGITVQLGLIIGSIVSLPMLLGSDEMWHLMFWFEFATVFATIAVLPFIPESPKYILATDYDYDKARASLIFFNHQNVEEDIHEIESEMESEKKLIGLMTIFRKPYLRRGLIIGFLTLIACQTSGIGAIACYSTALFRKAGVHEDIAPFATCAITLILLLSSIMSSFIVDRLGRKPLILVGLLSLAALNLIYIIFTFIGRQTGASWPGYVVIVDNILFTFMFGIGPAVVMWFVIAELMPQAARSTAISFVQASQWVIGCLVNAIFFPLSNIVHEWSFFMFIVPLVLISIYLYFKFPETKNKTTLEIMESLGYVIGMSRTVSKEEDRNGELKKLFVSA
jgi:MFS family permease